MSELSKKIFSEVDSQKNISLQRLVSTATPLRNACTRATLIIRREISDLQFHKKDGSQYSCNIASSKYSLDSMINERSISGLWVNYLKENDEPITTSLRFCYNKIKNEFILGYDRNHNEFSCYEFASDPTIITENFIRTLMESGRCSPRLKSIFNLEQIEYFIIFLDIIENNFKSFFYNLKDCDAPGRMRYNRYLNKYNHLKNGFLGMIIGKLNFTTDTKANIESQNEFYELIKHLLNLNLLPDFTRPIDNKQSHIQSSSAEKRNNLIRFIKFCKANKLNLSDPNCIDQQYSDLYWKFLVLYPRHVVFNGILSNPLNRENHYIAFDQERHYMSEM